MENDLCRTIKNILPGYRQVHYQGSIYGLECQIYNNGKSGKVFARDLGGKEFISFNWYQTSKDFHLKPCEMPLEKIMHFLHHFT
jgi:peptide-methionine (S)-S-oxide reductase